ncbi:Interferon-related developmental regulator 1, partial [Operophtera brumata]
MRTRTGTLALLALIGCARASRHPTRTFNITDFTVPPLVYAGQADVQISCLYEGNFTMLQFFKGTNEIFRFKPSIWPAIRSYPVPGVGSVSTDHCGSSSCHIQLSNLTERATGLYRCDLEHDTPPHLYTTRSANMTVQAAPRRMPFIDGFASEYGEGEDMQAVCRIEPGSMVKWFVNGHILIPLYGLRTFKYKSTRSMFLGEPPVMKLQCLEERGFTTLGSKIVEARWTERCTNRTTDNEESKMRKLAGSDCHKRTEQAYSSDEDAGIDMTLDNCSEGSLQSDIKSNHDEPETDIQEKLEEKVLELIDALGARANAARATALVSLRAALQRRYLAGVLCSHRATLADHVSKALRRGRDAEKKAAAALAPLLALQIGEEGAEEFVNEVRPALAAAAVRMAAGGALAVAHERVTDEAEDAEVSAAVEAVLPRLDQLSRDSHKYRAKRDRKIQRATFRDILKYFE